jgi:flagellar basal-body rod protein FlgF/flagellar basal-body rod protein FlgG
MIERLKQSMQALEVMMKAQQVVANNLANINTPGYKAEKLFYRAFRDAIHGRTIADVEPYQGIDMQQGALNKTGNLFDFGIQGPGFFEVQKNGRMLLRRSGHFKLNPNGYLVDAQGARVMGVSGPIQLPALMDAGPTQTDTDINVAKDGTVSINGHDYGRIKLIQVKNPQEIERLGNAYYSAPGDLITKTNVAGSSIMQGYSESSNVDAMTGLVNMTKNMRLFESQQRVMRSMNQALSQATTKLSRY